MKIPKKKHIISTQQIKDLYNIGEELKEKQFKEAITLLFTPYQISLIMRKANNLILSKTDREVFSRVIIKKLRALANEALFNLSEKIIYGS